MRKLIFVFILLVTPCRAKTIIVGGDGVADFNNIQAAINDSNDGDVIIVSRGIYRGRGNRDINFNGLAITVRSVDPNDPNIVAAIIIDCNGTETEPHRGFYFGSGEDANSILDGLTVTNGFTSGDWPGGRGGGIACYNQSSPSIRNCIITNNKTTVGGGGIYCYESSPTLTNCTISNNLANFGGGIYNSSGSGPVLTGCTFRANTAKGNYGDGGAMANQLSAPTLANCTFTGNAAFGYGGGGVANKISSPLLTDCTFIANQATNGGGMRNYESSPTLLGCIFRANSADEGGGIYNISYSSPILFNCTFSANSAFYFGGAMSNWYYSNPTLTNCIFSANSAVQGGAIESYTAGPILSNCTFTANSALSGDGHALACDSYQQVHPSSVAITNSILWDGSDEIWNNDNSTITIIYSDIMDGWSGTGNIDVDPCFVELGYWVDANDPNSIVEPNDPNAVWIDGDYHLKSRAWRWDTNYKVWTRDSITSRCIDAGNPGSPLGQEPLSVPDDPNNKWGRNLRIDMGAYGGTAEASMPPQNWALLADLTNDGIVDISDLENWTESWLKSGSHQPGDLNRNGIVDLFDFALLAQDWFAQTIWHP